MRRQRTNREQRRIKMLRELRKVKKRSKSNYIRNLQYAGRIGKYINAKGYCCYDPQELMELKAKSKKGRPPKTDKEGEKVYVVETN